MKRQHTMTALNESSGGGGCVYASHAGSRRKAKTLFVALTRGKASMHNDLETGAISGRANAWYHVAAASKNL